MKESAACRQDMIDPVCCMKVSPDHTHLTYTHQDHTYYFCAEGCRKAFAANPEKYLNAGPRKPKGWWQRYLARLERATGGQAQKCH